MSGIWARAVEPDTGAIAVHLIRLARTVRHAARKLHFVVARLGLHRGDDAVHRIDAVKIVRGHDHGPVGVLQGGGKSATDHIAQHVENHHIGVFQQVMLLQQLHRLPHHIAAATRAGRGTARLDAFHAVKSGGDVILGPQFLGMEIDRFQNVDHGFLQAVRSG